MGPELEIKEKSKVPMEVLVGKENEPATQDPKDKRTNNSGDERCCVEVARDGQDKCPDGTENMEVDILECRNSVECGEPAAGWDDTTESMSSFGNTVSETDDGPMLSDTEVESRLGVADGSELMSNGFGGLFPLRRKRLTDHWRRFIRPLMWRCKWIELQIKELWSQALKYDRELADHEHKKQFDFETFLVEGFHAKSHPFSSCAERKVMERKKRRKLEETTDIGPAFTNHTQCSLSSRVPLRALCVCVCLSLSLSLKNGVSASAMDAAAPRLVYGGIEPRRLASLSHCPPPLPARIHFRGRKHGVFSVATEPKPTQNRPAKSSPLPGSLNGSSRSLPSPAVNGVSSPSKSVNGVSAKPSLSKPINGVSTKPTPTKPVNGVSTRIGEVSEEIKRVRAQMEENEQLATLMRGLRGQNLRDAQFADENVRLRLVEVDESSEFLPLVYDPASISSYWGKRPRAVATRIVQLLSVAGGFLSRLAWDVINKKFKENEVARAIELREIITSLGPAYIKLGQALSIRPDILSPAAMTELQKLCDKVPSFPDDVAMALIKEELGQPWQNIYSELSSSPIAAASLGQVYKGRLKENGDLVAVKVQRPFVLETVTVDLYIIRNLGLVLRKFPQISIDIVGLVDEWASRFFEELDYVNEGENGTLFAEMIRKDLPQVVVPKTYHKYTSRKVLTTGWIEGEKLSQSTESDVGELVNVGVICYLKQLLDTGFFHADPHPGNLIRTPDGKLSILDFGLVTKLTDDQKYGMIEAIAHLIHRDYGAIVKDFVKLGFIPEGVNLEPILPVLARVFDQALEGGGAKNINFQELAADLAQITFDYPFRIPPYFALIIRAIGVLEGIALVGNPDFAIVDEAYPYIAQRLLTDESPRLRSALRYTIYGKTGVFDAERFIDVMQAFENFISAAKSGGGENLNGDMAELGILQSPTSYIIPVFPFSASQPAQPVRTRAALAFLLSERGNFFREFLLDEIVKGIDAVTREQLVQIMAVLGVGNTAPVFSMVPGPFRPAVLLPTITEEDRVILDNVQKVVEFLTAGSSITRTSNQVVNVAQIVQELLPVLPGITATVLPEVLSRLTSRVVARFIRDAFLQR